MSDVARFVASERPPLAAIFPLFDEEFRRTVVKRALNYRSKASSPLTTDARQALKDLPVRGYKDASKAKTEMLMGPVWEAIEHRDRSVADVTLRLWAESQRELREKTEDYLRRHDVSVPATPREFDSYWSYETWLSHRTALLEQDDSLDPDSAGVMLCLVAGRFPASPPLDSDRFREWTRELRKLAPEAPEWAEADAFTSWVLDIRGSKQREAQTRGKERALKRCEELGKEFEEDLRFFGVKPGPWTKDIENRPALLTPALEFLTALREQLEEYRRVLPRAETRVEEEKRVAERAACQDRIDGMVKEWEKRRKTPEPKQPVRKRARLSTAAPKPEETKKLAELRRENAALRAELKRLESEDDAKLKLAKQEAAEALRREAEMRTVYEQARTRQEEEVEEVPVEVTSVRHALEVAQERFPDELLIALNTKSKDDTPFERPQEVYDALTWLATDFRAGRTKIEEVCPGWSYRARQSTVTMGSSPEWYETRVNGKLMKLPRHIKKGKAHDPRYTIRIGFEKEEETGRVVIGYVGLHQRTAQS